MRELFTKENVTLFISILGACAWLPMLLEKIKSPKIECKVLKYDWLENGKLQYQVPFGNGLQKEVNGTIFILYMRIICRNIDFPLGKFSVKIKFDSMSKESDTYVHFSPNFFVGNLNKTFYSTMENNILYCPVLKKDEIYDLEAHFIVENQKNDVEYIKLIFRNTKGKEQTVKIEKDDFKYAFKTFV